MINNQTTKIVTATNDNIAINTEAQPLSDELSS